MCVIVIVSSFASNSNRSSIYYFENACRAERMCLIVNGLNISVTKIKETPGCGKATTFCCFDFFKLLFDLVKRLPWPHKYGQNQS